MDCAMEPACRYSLVQSWASQRGPSSMEYFVTSGDGASGNPLLRNTDAGRMMADIEAVNRCNSNTECRGLLVSTVSAFRALPPQVLQESYSQRGENQASNQSTAIAPTLQSAAPAASASSRVPQDNSSPLDAGAPTFSPENRTIVEFDRDSGFKASDLVVNGRQIIDPAGPITMASDSNYRGIVTYVTGLGDGVIGIDNVHINDFRSQEIATIRVHNWYSNARKVEVTTTGGDRISGADFWPVPGGIWVVRELGGTTGFLYSPETGVMTVNVPDTHYIFSMIKGDPLGTGWVLVGARKKSLLGGNSYEWLNIETGELFGAIKMFSPFDYGYKGAFQGETKLGTIAIIHDGGGSRVRYINFDKRESKLLLKRGGGINEYSVYLLENGDISIDAWGGLTGVQEIDSMETFIANPAKFKDVKMIQLEDWGIATP